MPPRRAGVADGDGGDGAEGGEAGLVVGEGGGVEVVVAVGGEEGAVDDALLEAGDDGLEVRGEGLGGGGGVGGSGGSGRGGGENERGNLLGDVGGGSGGFLVGEDGDGDVVVGEEDVFSDEATDFAGVLDSFAAVDVEDFNAQAVVGVLTVGEHVGGLHLLVAGRG